MKIAHLILVHTQPLQLKKLLNRLSHPDADCYIHLDAKLPAAELLILQSLPRVYIIQKRVKITPNSFSTVQATLDAFEEIVATGIQYDYINMLSGQDYPLNEAAFIHQYFALHTGMLFIEAHRVNEYAREALSRIDKYHLAGYNLPCKHKLERVANKLLPRRRLPNDLEAVGGSPWFTITGAAVKYILHYLHSHPEVMRYFRMTWAPHQFVFQTILHNSGYQAAIVNKNLRCMYRSEANPGMFNLTEMLLLERSHCLFAQKTGTYNGMETADIMDSHSVYKVSA